ncbi:MAG: AAA family ATPase [Caldimonas sp.]
MLLAGEFAYKIKKPVRLGFLDFSTLAARQRGCEEELRLNQRLASSLYVGVIAVRADGPDATLTGDGPVVDYAVKMHRFPADALASERLARGTLDAADLTQLAIRLASFHDDARVADLDSRFGRADMVLSQALHALDALAPLVADDCAPLRRWFTTQAEALTASWERRRACGRVLECHGDLHLDNVLLLHDDVTAFDCLEFDPALRWIDVMNDIAYLMMDLLAHERRDLAFGFLDAYLEASGDYDGLDVLRYYLVYRAVVRALVNALREGVSGGCAGLPARTYLRLAQRLADEATRGSRLLITHGLPGSGKSHVSRQLLACAGAVRLRSDVVRKRLAGLPPLADSRRAGNLYTQVGTDSTYARLVDLARAALRGGFPTIVDAAFLQRAQRERLFALARELRVPLVILDCQAPLPELRRRVTQRLSRGDDASEADASVLTQLSESAEPFDDGELSRVMAVRTDLPLDPAGICARWFDEPPAA